MLVRLTVNLLLVFKSPSYEITTLINEIFFHNYEIVLRKIHMNFLTIFHKN